MITEKLILTVKETPVKSLGRCYKENLSHRNQGVEVINQAKVGPYRTARKLQAVMLTIQTVSKIVVGFYDL